MTGRKLCKKRCYPLSLYKKPPPQHVAVKRVKSNIALHCIRRQFESSHGQEGGDLHPIKY